MDTVTTYTTEEKSDLVEMKLTLDSTEVSAALTEMQALLTEVEEDNAILTSAAEQEISDHNETTKKLAAAEFALLRLFAHVQGEYGFDLDQLDEDKALADFIRGAQQREAIRVSFETERSARASFASITKSMIATAKTNGGALKIGA